MVEANQLDAITIVFLISGILGGIGGLEAAVRLYRSVGRTKGQFTWHDVEKGTKILIEKINDSNFTPDAIIGVGRGGSILAALLSGNLGILPLYSIDRRYDWTDKKNRQTVMINPLDEKFIKNKKILLVLAFPYTGETLRKAREQLISWGANEVKTASLVKTEVSSFVSDFYAYKIKQVTKEPWRISEKYKTDSLHI